MIGFVHEERRGAPLSDRDQRELQENPGFPVARGSPTTAYLAQLVYAGAFRRPERSIERFVGAGFVLAVARVVEASA